jgi:hypothetical protein
MPCENLFQRVDKHFVHLIENKPHPPIIALIMRRSTGIQVLECHVFICRSTGEAQVIVNEIKTACQRYKHEMSQKTQIFQYKPYSNEASSSNGNTSSGVSSKSVSQQQQQQQIHHPQQPVELPLRIQDRVETKTILSNDVGGCTGGGGGAVNYSRPPKSPFFKTSSSKTKGPAHITTEKTYETSYIDNKSSASSSAANVLNKTCVVQQQQQQQNSIARNLGTKSSSHISAKGPASASSTSLFSKIKSNLRDRSLSKSNTNLNMGNESSPPSPKRNHRHQNGERIDAAMVNGSSPMIKSQKKSTFKQLKSKKNGGDGKESLPLSSTSSITFGSKLSDSLVKGRPPRPVSSLSNRSDDDDDDGDNENMPTASPMFVKRIDKTSMKASASHQQLTAQNHYQHPQSILVNGTRRENGSSGPTAVNVFYDDDNVSVKSDSYANNTTSQSARVAFENKKEPKKVIFEILKGHDKKTDKF